MFFYLKFNSHSLHGFQLVLWDILVKAQIVFSVCLFELDLELETMSLALDPWIILSLTLVNKLKSIFFRVKHLVHLERSFDIFRLVNHGELQIFLSFDLINQHVVVYLENLNS